MAVDLLEHRLEPREQRVAGRVVGGELLDAERGEVAIARAPQRRDLIDAALDRGLAIRILREQRLLRRGDVGAGDRVIGLGVGRRRLRRHGRRPARVTGHDEDDRQPLEHAANVLQHDIEPVAERLFLEIELALEPAARLVAELAVAEQGVQHLTLLGDDVDQQVVDRLVELVGCIGGRVTLAFDRGAHVRDDRLGDLRSFAIASSRRVPISAT